MRNSRNFNCLLKKQYWSTVPLGLIALLIFSAASTIFSVYHYFYASDELRAIIVPHVGWIGTYIYFMFFMFSILLVVSRQTKLRKNIVFGFLLLTCYGIFNYYVSQGRDNYGNPYLTYGAYKPIWDIVIPLLWLVVLTSKPVKKYCSSSGI